MNQKNLTTWGRLWRKFLVFLACAIVFNLVRYATLKLPLNAYRWAYSVNAQYLAKWSIASVPLNLAFGSIAAVEHLNGSVLHRISFYYKPGSSYRSRYSVSTYWADVARECRGTAIKRLTLFNRANAKSILYNFSLNTCETILTMPVGIVLGSLLTGLSATEYSYQYGLSTGDDDIMDGVKTGVINVLLYVACFVPYRIYRKRLRRADGPETSAAKEEADAQPEPDAPEGQTEESGARDA